MKGFFLENEKLFCLGEKKATHYFHNFSFCFLFPSPLLMFLMQQLNKSRIYIAKVVYSAKMYSKDPLHIAINAALQQMRECPYHDQNRIQKGQFLTLTLTGCPLLLWTLCLLPFLGFQSSYDKNIGHFREAHKILILKMSLILKIGQYLTEIWPP